MDEPCFLPEALDLTDFKAQTRTYQHQPLDQSQRTIRLVSISPDLSAEGYIQCRIRQTTIKDSYQCLSYRWGPLRPSRNVLLGDSGEQKPFEVGQNLFEFLEVVRELDQRGGGAHGSRSGPRRADNPELGTEFWIDAICIDQENDSERNQQVAQMNKLYSHAYRVVAWLGLKCSFDPSMGNIRDNLLAYEKAISEREYNGEITERDYDGGIIDWSSDFNRSAWLQQFCNNEYWTRAWITQEVILSKCTLVLINSSLVDLALLVRRLQVWDLPSRLISLSGRKLSLLYLLDYLRNQQCCLPHDRIYSLLGLVDRRKNIIVDYKLSLADLAYNVLQACRPVRCLCCVMLVVQVLGVHLDSANQYDRGPFVKLEMEASLFDKDTRHIYSSRDCSQIQPAITHFLRLAPEKRLVKNYFTGRGIAVRIRRDRAQARRIVIRVALWALLPTQGLPPVTLCHPSNVPIVKRPTLSVVGIKTGLWKMLKTYVSRSYVYHVLR
jgi:hypothetical protein